MCNLLKLVTSITHTLFGAAEAVPAGPPVFTLAEVSGDLFIFRNQYVIARVDAVEFMNDFRAGRGYEYIDAKIYCLRDSLEKDLLRDAWRAWGHEHN